MAGNNAIPIDKAEIFAKLKSLISESLGVDPSEVVPDASFIDDLGANSLDTVELVDMVEREFNIEIPEDDAEKISTVQEAVDYLFSRQFSAQGE